MSTIYINSFAQKDINMKWNKKFKLDWGWVSFCEPRHSSGGFDHHWDWYLLLLLSLSIGKLIILAIKN